MVVPFFDKPILNAPYGYPSRHWELDADGQPTNRIIEARRRSELITPVPRPRRRRRAPDQVEMVYGIGDGLSSADQEYNPTPIINEIRSYVDTWRNLPAPDHWLVTPETARLLQHWRHHPFQGIRPFFCQVEAVETVIWLTEVAPKRGSGSKFWEHLKGANEQANPELLRLALKLATGAGKTTVMAMLIAWQTVNAVRHPSSRHFSRGFLIITPGITIRDRLRVLQPNDPDSYYHSREIVPSDMLSDIDRAKIVITNYHAFKRRERLDISPVGRALLKGRGPDLDTLETEGQMLQRVMPELMGMKTIVALNDEAHHCYRQRPQNDDLDDLQGDDKNEAKRTNIPTVEYQAVMREEEQNPLRVAYARRNRDLDPQLVWRGKDEQDWSDLVVQAPPLYIQEKVHPKVLIDDLMRQSKARAGQDVYETLDLFADFNGLPDQGMVTEFYQHDQNWTNRMILGDSLQVMASLAEREGLCGQVQCIYLDPPYGIKFNSNFQWSTTSRDVKDGNKAHISHEPEQVKAFRDTWRDGLHSYLTYLRDRLTVARDLLADSGSIFVQIGDENVHRVRVLMDEIFGEENFASEIVFRTSSGRLGSGLDGVFDILIWYAKDKTKYKYRAFLADRTREQLARAFNYVQREDGTHFTLTKDEMNAWLNGDLDYDVFQPSQTQSQSGGDNSRFVVTFEGKKYQPPAKGGWRSTPEGFERLGKAKRLYDRGKTVRFRLKHSDYPFVNSSNIWMDTLSTSFGGAKVYVVETNPLVVQRCILMTTDPGDLVLDPTCGSGTTAYVAEQWGRRWITIDTSRVALALARARIMGARYPYYLLADTPEGQRKEAEVTRTVPSIAPTHGNIRQGFVYERVPHITLKSIANNAEIDVIWERFQKTLEPLRDALNAALGTAWEEWEIPREAGDEWSAEARDLHTKWWEARIARQKEIDASIGAKADFEYLYDKPYIDNARIRVAGPFTVESLSPHRVLAVDQDDELLGVAEAESQYLAVDNGKGGTDFAHMVLDHLKTSGVQQAHKADKVVFASIIGWPGNFICAEGRFMEGETERRAGIFIGPEFGTVARPDLVAAAREAADAAFDVLIAFAFNFDAHSAEFNKLGRIPILKARMNADLHMADDLKNTGQGNLFVVFGEPDIDIEDMGDGKICVKIHGVDVFHPQTGEIDSGGPDTIAVWFIDTDYNEESFFVRHAYFLGASDPYKALKTTLKADIDEEAWASLYRDVSRLFEKPTSGRIAVKVINHLGDEVMKVFRVL